MMAHLNSEIIELYRGGQTLQELGAKYNLTRERIRQLIQSGIYFEVQKSKSLKNGEKSIEELDLNNRTFNSLVSAGILSLEKLTSLTEDEIMSLPSMGGKGLLEIKSKLLKAGLFFRQIEQDLGTAISQKSRNTKYTPVETLQLNPRTLNALIKNGIWGIEHLTEYPIHQLRKLNGIGKKAINEIEQKLKEKNLSLGMSTINLRGEKEISKKEDKKRHMYSPMIVHQDEFQDYFINLKKDHRKNWILKHRGDVSRFAEMAKRYHSINKFIFDSKIGTKEILKEYFPEIYEVIKKNEQEIKKRWHKYYIQCIECGTTTVPYRSHGRCKNCYFKGEDFKRIQKASRARNFEKWRAKMNEYRKEYGQRPEIKEKMKRRDDLKKYDGNREKAIARDHYQCVNCKISRKESFSTLNEDLCVIRVDGNSKNSQLDNLQTLCRKCFFKKHFRKK